MTATVTSSPAAGTLQVFGPDDGSAQTAQTQGMLRRELVVTPGAWVGSARTQPGVTSGWHHHGDYDTFITVQAGRIRMEFGAGGGETCEAGPGELIFVPKGAVHRESNPGVTEQVILLVRVGSGDPVFNVDGPAD
jgi:uncharacterized RmlC-like cupin family protein